MIAIIDYGVGNLYSLASSFRHIGQEVVISKNKEMLRKADKLILPGVGAFKDAREKLSDSGLDSFIIEEAEKGKPILGICLGMQLLFEKSFEYGEHSGLGLLKGNVISMKGLLSSEYKVPHMGWNQLHFIKKPISSNEVGEIEKHQLTRFINEGDYVYFVHSYFATDCMESLIATTDYGIPITAMVGKNNIMGCQFHPEKSGAIGLNILRGFCEEGVRR